MVQFLDPLLIVALALNFVALGREPDPRRHQRGRRRRASCSACLPLFVHPEIGAPRHPAGRA